MKTWISALLFALLFSACSKSDTPTPSTGTGTPASSAATLVRCSATNATGQRCTVMKVDAQLACDRHVYEGVE